MSPYSAFKRVNLDALYMGFLQPLLDAVADCAGRGLAYEAYCGTRTFAEQLALWAQGRTKAGHVVTNAGPGQSPHNFGLACDFVRVDKGEADWKPEDYRPLGEAAEKYGLLWGGRWEKPDWDHLQLHGYVTAEDMAPLRVAYLGTPGGLTDVFQYLDAKGMKS